MKSSMDPIIICSKVQSHQNSKTSASKKNISSISYIKGQKCDIACITTTTSAGQSNFGHGVLET